MSGTLLGQEEIDVLVQVALAGCVERPWTPLVGDPHAFGQDLWDRNWFVVVGSALGDDYEAAAAVADEVYGEHEQQRRPRGYRFRPLPGMVTAAEAALACDHYGYQTYCDFDDPLSDGPVPPLGTTPAGWVYEEVTRRVTEVAGDQREGTWGGVPDTTGRPAPDFPDGLL